MSRSITGNAELAPDHVVAVAHEVERALLPFVGADWSVRAGSLEWDVERTVTHMAGAVAKYVLYVASAAGSYISFAFTRSEGATNEEVIRSIVPVAQALASVVGSAPADAQAFHIGEQIPVRELAAIACEELLVHTFDVLAGLGRRFEPAQTLVGPVMAAASREELEDRTPWESLLVSFGRLG